MLEGKIRKILKYIDEKYPHQPDWKVHYIVIKKVDINSDYYDIYINPIPTPIPIYFDFIRRIFS
jgi:hypothetical protein